MKKILFAIVLSSIIFSCGDRHVKKPMKTAIQFGGFHKDLSDTISIGKLAEYIIDTFDFVKIDTSKDGTVTATKGWRTDTFYAWLKNDTLKGFKNKAGTADSIFVSQNFIPNSWVGIIRIPRDTIRKKIDSTKH